RTGGSRPSHSGIRPPVAERGRPTLWEPERRIQGSATDRTHPDPGAERTSDDKHRDTGGIARESRPALLHLPTETPAQRVFACERIDEGSRQACNAVPKHRP